MGSSPTPPSPKRKEKMSDSLEELIKKWEPKIFGMSHRVYIRGMSPDDIAQELRIVLIKAYYRDAGKASFHTFLHVCMKNRITDLIRSAQRIPKETDQEFESNAEEYHWWEVLPGNLTEDETKLANLIIHGYNYGYITNELGDKYRETRNSLKEKCSFLLGDAQQGGI